MLLSIEITRDKRASGLDPTHPKGNSRRAHQPRPRPETSLCTLFLTTGPQAPLGPQSLQDLPLLWVPKPRSDPPPAYSPLFHPSLLGHCRESRARRSRSESSPQGSAYLPSPTRASSSLGYSSFTMVSPEIREYVAEPCKFPALQSPVHAHTRARAQRSCC